MDCGSHSCEDVSIKIVIFPLQELAYTGKRALTQINSDSDFSIWKLFDIGGDMGQLFEPATCANASLYRYQYLLNIVDMLF